MPGGSTPGTNVLECAPPPGIVHAPPAVGVPPNDVKRLIAAPLLHTATFALVPGSAWLSTVIVMQSVLVQSGWPTWYTVTQYCVVPPTVAVGFAIFGLLSPAAGDQLYTKFPPGQLATPLQSCPVPGPIGDAYTTPPPLLKRVNDCSPL